MPWPRSPLIYEINTWVWLAEQGREAGRPLTLASVPAAAWDAIAALNFDAVWLMGVWERSPAGIGISMRNEGLLADFRRSLPDFTDMDNVGSPYCIREYRADARLGGPKALAEARRQLADRGLLLILDYVPNHVAPDHPWVEEHPEYFIRGDDTDLAAAPGSFIRIGGEILALGRDPCFPAWPDVLQLNAFSPGMRDAALNTIDRIADQCDGVRCDMAMLMLGDVFQRTWGDRAGPRPEQDYWRQVIAPGAKRPEFLFIAEAYWDLEWDLMQQGFDFCYDKRLYDRLAHGTAEEVRLHCGAVLEYQEKLVRFIENHDEPRAAAAFGSGRQRAMAVTALTLPGAALVHEGQLEGRGVQLPVFLARRPDEDTDRELLDFYRTLLETLRSGEYKEGEWSPCACEGWPDNVSCRNLVAWSWRTAASRCLVVVNLSGSPAQGLVKGLGENIAGSSWRLRDALTSTVYDREGDEMLRQGLYVDLPGWGFHFLEWNRSVSDGQGRRT